MSTRDTGGLAFPNPIATNPMGDVYQSWQFGEGGMTLRDHFAGVALAGHLASLAPGSWGNDGALAADAARGAYLVADAMIAERKL